MKRADPAPLGAQRARLNLRRLLRVVSTVASFAPFALSIDLAWTAFVFPLELEIREGTVWLHALAKKADIDIYDSTKVVFVNMNHGPVDSILKGWAASYLPFLTPSMVTRLFVLLLPFFLLGSAYFICRRRWSSALLASGALYLALSELTPMLLVGRSDATAMSGLAVGLALVNAQLCGDGPAEIGRRAERQVWVGASSAFVFLTCWRDAPAVALLQALVLCFEVRKDRRFRSAALSCALYALGFALLFAPIFLFELHGDWRTLYQRFFGFFTTESGWGSRPGDEFRLFPREVVERALGTLVIGILALAGIYRLRRRPLELASWLVGLPLLWTTTSFAYYRNQGGGGIWYYCPFFLILWLFLLRSLVRRGWSPGIQAASTILLLFFLPWKAVKHRQREVAAMQADARSFLREVEERTRGEAILSEDVHLFRKRYDGEVVDMGDTAAAIAKSGYYGQALTATFRIYEDRFRFDPPRFIMAGCLGYDTPCRALNPVLRALLEERYTAVLRGPRSFIAWGGGYAALFERNPP